MSDNWTRAGEHAPGNWDFERNREFFGCTDMSEEDVDGLVEIEMQRKGNGWLKEMDQKIRRVYVMSIRHARERQRGVV